MLFLEQLRSEAREAIMEELQNECPFREAGGRSRRNGTSSTLPSAPWPFSGVK